MTEKEWVVCDDPERMLFLIKQLRTLRKHVKQRKQRLFAVACCRRLWPLLDNVRSHFCVEVAERLADNQASNEEVRSAEQETNTLWLSDAPNEALFACHQLFWKEVNGLHVSTSSLSAIFNQLQHVANEPFEPLDGRRKGACLSEERAQADLLRCIFGNPFRPVAFADSWQSEAAVALASAIYTERAFDRMPVLADALEDAGCDHADVLAHCRGPGPHARGCWVVDGVLGKE